jgi:hypothetical protein
MAIVVRGDDQMQICQENRLWGREVVYIVFDRLGTVFGNVQMAAQRLLTELCCT